MAFQFDSDLRQLAIDPQSYMKRNATMGVVPVSTIKAQSTGLIAPVSVMNIETAAVVAQSNPVAAIGGYNKHTRTLFSQFRRHYEKVAAGKATGEFKSGPSNWARISAGLGRRYGYNVAELNSIAAGLKAEAMAKSAPISSGVQVTPKVVSNTGAAEVQIPVIVAESGGVVADDIVVSMPSGFSLDAIAYKMGLPKEVVIAIGVGLALIVWKKK